MTALPPPQSVGVEHGAALEAAATALAAAVFIKEAGVDELHDTPHALATESGGATGTQAPTTHPSSAEEVQGAAAAVRETAPRP